MKRRSSFTEREPSSLLLWKAPLIINYSLKAKAANENSPAQTLLFQRRKNIKPETFSSTSLLL